jgi:ankyrin repeat protein
MSYSEFVKLISKVESKKLKELISKGVNINIQDSDGNTPLIYASYKGYYNIVKLLLEKGSDANICNKLNDNALIESLINGKLETSKILIEKTDNVNIVTTGGTTALTHACEKGYTEIIKLLVKKGANINFRNHLNGSGFDYALDSNNLDLMKLLLSLGLKLTQKDLDQNLGFACKKNVTNLVKFMLDLGGNPNGTNLYGDSALLLTISGKGDEKNIKMLVAKGADVNYNQSNTCNLLMFALHLKKNNIFKLLHSLGTNINYRNDLGLSVLDVAINSGNLEIIEYLCNNNVDINSVNQFGRNALFTSIMQNKLQIVKLLCKHNIDVTTPDFENITAIYSARKLKHYSIMNFLNDYVSTEETDNLIDITCYDLVSEEYLSIKSFMKNKNNILVQDGKVLYGMDKQAFLNDYNRFGYLYSGKRLLPSNLIEFLNSKSRYYYMRDTGLDISFIVSYEIPKDLKI